ncbi:cysteine protease StiP family protein [Neisseriaceae bacterium ESL0693]|nr:cysteine protease StiP family protein [Neisseriaceae bacterium ESL0693]
MIQVIPFSGSYHEGDVQFLLEPIQMAFTPLKLKEKLIQSGEMHYSDMLSQEPIPTQYHLDIFSQSLSQNLARMATEVMQIARALIQYIPDKTIVLVSLVRAGVPLGVMLHQTLKSMGKASIHYGISIIRDRGIDTTALEYIESRHGTESIIFVDGWTGKGAISHELEQALKNRTGYPEKPRLVVLTDPCGCAWLAASDDDWLIPFGIMGAPVSGLISRSVWSADGLHGCVKCDHLQEYDCSNMLVNKVRLYCEQLKNTLLPDIHYKPADNQQRWQLSQKIITQLSHDYHINNLNRIKPGIAEATRAVLRRVPEHVLVCSYDDPDVALLVKLAKDKNIPITETGHNLGRYRAVTIIKKVGK